MDNSRMMEAYESCEFQLFKLLGNVGESYAQLTNCTSEPDAAQHLQSFRVAVAETERYTLGVLRGWCSPPAHLIQVVNDRTTHRLSNVMVNAMHYYKRLCNAQNQAQKTRELTAFYYLIKELGAIAETAFASEYYKLSELNRELTS